MRLNILTTVLLLNAFILVSDGFASIPRIFNHELISATGWRAIDWSLIERIIVSEAAAEGYWGMYAVGCVLRNRDFDVSGFSSVGRIDLLDFYGAQPEQVRDNAAAIVQSLRSGAPDITHGATHFENIEIFGLPYWAEGMTATIKIGQHTFWRE